MELNWLQITLFNSIYHSYEPLVIIIQPIDVSKYILRPKKYVPIRENSELTAYAE